MLLLAISLIIKIQDRSFIFASKKIILFLNKNNNKQDVSIVVQRSLSTKKFMKICYNIYVQADKNSKRDR